SDGGLRPIEIVPLLTRREESESKLRETADWIVARHPEWGAALVDYFEEALLGLGGAGADADSDAAAQSREDLRRRLLQFVEDSDILELLVGVLRSSDYSADAKRIVLQVMGDSGNEILPMDWLVELERLVRSDEIALTREAVAVLRKVPAKGSGVKALTVALVALGHNEDAPEDLRLAALAAVPGGLREVDEGLLGLLGENLDSEQPVSSRAAAVDVLVKAVLTNGQLIELTETLASVSPLDIEGLLKAFERSQDETLGAALVAALAASPARSALREESLKPLMAKFPATVAEKAERLYEVLRTDRAEQHAHLEHLLATLPEGDIRRGQLVFMSAKAACSSCHEIGYLGGNVGPDLTHIAKIRSARDLLEAVVFPSASLVRSYEPSTVVTADGVVLNGLIREQTEEGILLATGPDKEVRLAHDEIEEILPSSVSVMPAGLDKQLTLQQLADVMAFLQSRN
ncbi:MAG: c-type cytochrome, partial [Planctomycetales bacterium]|nr:c-type cytochrome [Planctomycetales bacterium]